MQNQKKRRVGVQQRVASRQAAQSPDGAAAQLAAKDETIAQLRKELNISRQEKEAALEDLQRKHEEECGRIYKEVLEEYGGLSRASLLCDEWHEANPGAAKHLFGFRTWYETRAYIWALFDKKGPGRSKKKRRRTETISDFEKILITKMRIHRA